MPKSLNWENIWTLVKFYINDSIHGILSRPFFQRKSNRIIFGIGLFFAYYDYFLLNLREVQGLENISKFINSPAEILAEKITLVSLFDICWIFALICYVSVNMTVKLNDDSIFISKALPFTEAEVWFAQKIFKLLIGILLFEFIFIILFPVLKLFSISALMLPLVLLSANLLFVAGFILSDFLHDLWLNLIKRKLPLVDGIFNLALLLLAGIYLEKYRFKVECFLGKKLTSVEIIIGIYVVISVFLMTILMLLTVHLKLQTPTYRMNRYFKLTLPYPRLNLKTTMGAIIRNKATLYIVLVILSVLLFSFITASTDETLQLALFLLPLFGISGMYYGDATAKVGKLYCFYRISVMREVSSLLLTGIIISMPTLALVLLTSKAVEDFIFSITFFMMAVIIGFLFPKSAGNLNEAVSALLLMLMLILLSLALTVPWTLYVISVICLVLLSFILFKERGNKNEKN